MSGGREIILDTETTGLDRELDRVIEVGCVEVVDRMPTGKTFHTFVNPAPRRVQPGALKVHGRTDAFLSRMPPFEDIVDRLLDFIGGSTLVIHNAPFDVGMLNAEFARLFDPPPPIALSAVVDTLSIAKRKLPNLRSRKLDALAAHFRINAAARSRHHGALIDAEILAGVYRGLMPAEQQALTFAPVCAIPLPPMERRLPPARLTDAERERHGAFARSLGPSAVWLDYLGGDDAPA